MYKEPKIGDKIYVPSELHAFSDCGNDCDGGIATISKVDVDKALPEDHFNYITIGIKERPQATYSFKYLMDQQESLKYRYGSKVVHEHPHFRDEFNNSPDAELLEY